MDPDFAQRRRVAVALAITVIAVPGAFLLNRGPADDVAATPSITVSGIDTGTVASSVEGSSGDGQRAGGTSVTTVDVMGTAPIGFIEGTAVPVANDPATIGVPRQSDSITGTASFSRSITNATECQVKGLPFNARVTVTNLDNSHSVQCIGSVRAFGMTEDVVLHADAFLRIADLTDAPVHVKITW